MSSFCTEELRLCYIVHVIYKLLYDRLFSKTGVLFHYVRPSVRLLFVCRKVAFCLHLSRGLLACMIVCLFAALSLS